MNTTIALAQINPTIGDVAGNTAMIRRYYEKACEQGADLVVFPELCIIGYPPQDLLHRHRLIRSCASAVHSLAEETGSVPMIVGNPHLENSDPRRLHNSMAVLQEGEVICSAHKSLLPTYDVFDEDRYFSSEHRVQCVELNGTSVGLTICEDLWPSEFLPRGVQYDFDPIESLREHNPDLVINIAASPYWMGKSHDRRQIFTDIAEDLNADVVYCNTVGANDEIIFDGQSLVAGSDGTLLQQADAFQEDLLLTTPDKEGDSGTVSSGTEQEKFVLDALELGLRDYVRKTGFEQVLLGLSGGIDSAMTATIAARALGPDNVLGVSMPSRFTSSESRSDAEQLASSLGIRYEERAIEDTFESFLETLEPILGSDDLGTTSENIQARIRGTLLMAISNDTGQLLLATGNKSELSVGYCTLYGDMAGGLAPIGDVPKTLVYDLARYINDEAGEEVIPDNIITKPPSAELRPDQTDQDSLPPYDTLDEVLDRYIVREEDPEDISEDEDPDLVHEVVNLVDRSEFKRQQAAPVLKVTSRAFGIGRHMPIAKRITYPES
jgi:NAD+ synthetase